MKKGFGLGGVLIVVGIIVLAGVGYYYTENQKIGGEHDIVEGRKNYTEPLMECVDCIEGETWNNKECCTSDFESECLKKNGLVRLSDLHPAFTTLKGCFQKAPDVGKECASESDCLSSVCDLESAITSNKCALIEKNLTGDKNQFGGEEFFTATYSCQTTKPGECLGTRRDKMNPGGVLHSYKMEGDTLIETVESGPIF